MSHSLHSGEQVGIDGQAARFFKAAILVGRVGIGRQQAVEPTSTSKLMGERFVAQQEGS